MSLLSKVKGLFKDKPTLWEKRMELLNEVEASNFPLEIVYAMDTIVDIRGTDNAIRDNLTIKEITADILDITVYVKSKKDFKAVKKILQRDIGRNRNAYLGIYVSDDYTVKIKLVDSLTECIHERRLNTFLCSVFIVRRSFIKKNLEEMKKHYRLNSLIS